MDFRRIATLLTAAGLVFATPGGRSGGTGQRAGWSGIPSGNELASVGERRVQEMHPEESITLVLRLRPEEYLRFEASGWGAGIAMAVFGPQMQAIAATPLAEENPARLSLRSDSGGKYTIRISSASDDQAPSRFEVRIIERRRTRQTDSYLVKADLDYLQAIQLQKQWKVEADRQAVEKLEEAFRLSTAAGDTANAARVLCRLGDLFMDRGRTKDAIVRYEQSRDICLRDKDERGGAEALTRIGLATALGGDASAALGILEGVLQSSRDTGDTRNEALTLVNIGEAYYLTGQQPKALGFYEEAIKLWEITGDRRELARTYIYLGNTCSDLGEVSDAFVKIEESLRLWRAVGDRHGEALALTMLGLLFSRTGENQEAINRYRKAAELFHDGEDPLGEALLMDYLSFTYHSLGNLDAALDHSRQALALFRQTLIREGEAAQLRKIGEIHFDRGEYRLALDFLEKANLLYRKVRDRRMEAVSLCSIGKAQRALGNTGPAIRNLEEALKLSRTAANSVGQILTLNELGLARRDAGDLSRAEANFEEALLLARNVRFPFGEVQTRVHLAQTQLRLGNRAGALTNIETGVALIEALRTKVDVATLRISYFSTIRNAYDLYIGLLMDQHRRRPAEGYDGLALAISERARARSLLDLLEETRSGIRRGMKSTLPLREQELARLLNAKALRQMQLMSGDHSQADEDNLALELRRLNMEYDQLQAEIRIQDPRYAAVTQPAPLKAAEIQSRLLDENTLLLEYSLGAERSYLWAVSRDRLASYELPPARVLEDLAREVRDWLTVRQARRPEESQSQFFKRSLQADASYWKSAGQLSRILLGPVASRLSTCRLVIVADGFLHYLPFAALPVPVVKNAGGARAAAAGRNEPVPLIAEHEVVHLPSASTLDILRQQTRGRLPAPRSVAVLADPVYERNDPRLSGSGSAVSGVGSDGGRLALTQAGLPSSNPGPAYARLFFSQQEADGIAALANETGAKWTGVDASRQRATSDELARYRIIHFAVHGEVNDADPNLSGIVLSLYDGGGSEQDGFLRLHEIYSLHLPSELVVLSACSTGLGKYVHGEGLVGMVRGFMYAGAARVVASLWKVEDQPTAELMKRFYQGMLREGLAPAAALRVAQVEMAKHPKWSAPYYWAGFVLQGEYR